MTRPRRAHDARTAMNPWHDIPASAGKCPTGEESECFNAVIEIPKGGRVKYELDKRGHLRVDRILYSSVVYPHNYGFLSRTFADDGDALDVLVLCQEQLVPLATIRAVPVGVMHMVDGGKQDDKIIAVAADDPEFNSYTDVSQLPPHRMAEITRFFKDYKLLEGKQCEVDDNFGDAEQARRIVREAMELYDATYVDGKRRDGKEDKSE